MQVHTSSVRKLNTSRVREVEAPRMSWHSVDLTTWKTLVPWEHLQGVDGDIFSAWLLRPDWIGWIRKCSLFPLNFLSFPPSFSPSPLSAFLAEKVSSVKSKKRSSLDSARLGLHREGLKILSILKGWYMATHTLCASSFWLGPRRCGLETTS